MSFLARPNVPAPGRGLPGRGKLEPGLSWSRTWPRASWLYWRWHRPLRGSNGERGAYRNGDTPSAHAVGHRPGCRSARIRPGLSLRAQRNDPPDRVLALRDWFVVAAPCNDRAGERRRLCQEAAGSTGYAVTVRR